MGCNNTCTFCIVPTLRGKEADRRPGDILAEVEMLAAEGVLEVTLLGQNVNSYGAEFGDRGAFADLLRACGAIDGIERVRFTSPHPKDFTSDVITAMAETPSVCHQLHMPLQSGSDRILRSMRRSYRSERYLRILDEVREAMPDAAITTDIIVGFPGETEADFQQTLDVAARSGFATAYTFQYSPRPGTPAATMPDQVPPEVVTERYQRLKAVVDESSLQGNRDQLGRTVEVLVAAGEGRKDSATHRLSGRARDGRLVHFSPTGTAVDRAVRAGDVVTTVVTGAAPHHVVADGDLLGHRRTKAGDRHAEGLTPRTPGVGLGMPELRHRPHRHPSWRQSDARPAETIGEPVSDRPEQEVGPPAGGQYVGGIASVAARRRPDQCRLRCPPERDVPGHQTLQPQLLGDVEVPALGQQRSHPVPRRLVRQQVVALGEDHLDVGADRNGAGDGLLERAAELRRVDHAVSDARSGGHQPVQQRDVSGRVEGLRRPLDLGHPGFVQHALRQVVAVHRNQRGPDAVRTLIAVRRARQRTTSTCPNRARR